MKSALSRIFGGGDKTVTKESAENVLNLPISKIHPNRFQPRTIFDDSKIEELARTIHTHGIIQPIVVRTMENGDYEIIAGERRYRAMKSLQWVEVPAIIREMSDKETASVALIENLQREELTAIEEAQAFQQLLELHELTQEALAQRLGKGQSTVANKLRLLKLPEQIKESILKREISERHARALVPLKNEELQLQLLEEIKEQDYNVRQLEQRIREILEPIEKVKKPRVKRKSVSRDVRIALNTIRESLTLVNKTGIDVKAEEEEHDEYYQITVKIPKNKK
ncbi:MAG: nucleoid occlusion protein [Kurthia gibsonii]|uniref:Nucleoid occlusion protein n=1 Tax=Kurthia gibsonii TaxID=33946 RepID=A0ABU9LR28_9BACL|nr:MULTISPECIES: nucleoid occlusion protein [Kurthia]MCA9723918.1 nucleoid occlusion protein [Kurthia sp.]AMA62077.1 ParB/RepB/Spo0J family partition domain protein [Kurthia sp. 11kri321]MEB6113864.1 nucleoid occlusion protein [Kurthia gibsonii]MEB7773197.1 nucleoid occlusion protein [Kurthia gibsonii]RXH53214.1 nucleoid occlusion protein [Kurthia gibsonii]